MFGSGKKLKMQEEEMKSLKLEMVNLRKSEEDFKMKNIENEQRNVKLEQENKELVKQNKELNDKLDTEEPYEQIFNARRQLQEQIVMKNRQIEVLESKKKEMNESIESLKTEINKMKDETDKTRKEYETETSRTEDVFKEQEKSLNSRIAELESEKTGLTDELAHLKEAIQKREEEDEEKAKLMEQKEKDEKVAKAYFEDARVELAEHRSKVENLQLESEALKSENEALFRANEAKKKDMDEILDELKSIRNELKIEQQRFIKLKEEWDEEKKKTEFVLVSKSPNKSARGRTPIIEKEDSEDEHLVSVAEAARSEAETLREKERGLRKRVNQLQIDKEELFRSGTNLFAENKTLKNKYDDVCNERSRLLQVESTLEHKLRERDKEVKDLKRTIDDLYYQNLAIKSNEENERKKDAYIVVMGNEKVKKLEREKSALNRRIKFLERENHEIEQRVNDLERQSDALVQYSKKYDKHTPFPPHKGPFNVSRDEPTSRRDEQKSGDRERDGTFIRSTSHEEGGYSRQRRPTGERHGRDRPSPHHQYKEDHSSQDKQKARHDYRNDLRPPVPRIRSPDYYTNNAPPFVHQHSRQSSFAHSNQSHSSRISLPPLSNTYELDRSDSRSEKATSRRITSLRI